MTPRERLLKMRVLVVRMADDSVVCESDSARLAKLVQAWIEADKIIKETQARRMLMSLYPSSDSVKT